MWKKILGGTAIATALYFALGDDADASSRGDDASGDNDDYTGGGDNGGADSSGRQWGNLFEAFWQVAGREESRNRLDFWLADDVGRGASIGWMNFNQNFSIHLLMQEARRDDPSTFQATFGTYSAQLSSPGWVKSANLSQPDLKSLLVRWLGSARGERIQRKVANKYYFAPTMEMMDRTRPDADEAYRVVAASTRIFTSMQNVQKAVFQYPTAKAFTESFKQQYAGQDLWCRFDRQLKNAISMTEFGQLANR